MNVFIRRPVMTTLVMAATLVFGVMAYRQLPVSDLPNVDFPTLVVAASLPGASPETMASAVARPLEKQLSTIAGLDSMTSTSGTGSTLITLQFALDRDIDAAAQDVQAAIAVVQRQLPPDMPTPPSYQKVNPADQPIMWMGLTSPTLRLSELNEYAETLIAPRIATLPGVAQVQVYGAQKFAVRIQVDPRVLAARGLGIDQVVSAVQQANVNLPTGTIWGPNKAFTVKADGQLADASAFASVIVAWRDGAPVRLGDLGRVIGSVENDKVASWYNDSRAIVLAVQRQPGTNTVQVASAVRALLPRFRDQLPASVSLAILNDRSETIQESVRDVKFTLALAFSLVVLVIFIFLRNLSSTVIPSLALPLAVFGTFAVMYLLGYSIDNLSMMALTLAVGFVVDDAIVMLENIVRHMEMGKRPMQAALDGARQVGFTIVSMTLSLAAVFIPLLLMGGIIGRLFREFAVTISVAILVSGFVSLSLSPMLCSRFLKPGKGKTHGGAYAALEKAQELSIKAYGASLHWVVDRPKLSLVFSALVLVGSFALFGLVPKGFLPAEDTRFLFAITEAAEGISFEAMVGHQRAVAAILQQDPNVESFMSAVVSGAGGSAANQGRMFMRLKARSERELTADGVLQALRPKLNSVPGIRVYIVNPPPIAVGGRFGAGLYQFTLQSSALAELYATAPLFEARLRQLPELQDVSSDFKISNPEARLTIDRDRAAALGISPLRIEDALFSAFGSRQISTILAPNNQYQVILELLPEFQRDPSSLDLLYVRSSDSAVVPLKALAKLDTGVGPLTVNHQGQLPSVTFSFNLKPGVALGDAVGKVQKAASEVLPDSVTTSFAGAAQAFQAGQSGLLLLLVLAVLVIYIILGILYESFIHPLTILTALPFAGFGALLTLLVTGVDLNIYSFLGIILLIGVVKKNGIMMVDFALEAQRTEGKPAADAIFQACLVRFRPIMMTTMAALAASVPIAFGFGTGAESRRPLGLAVLGGLAFSQAITLYVTPVFYVAFDRLQQKMQRVFG